MKTKLILGNQNTVEIITELDYIPQIDSQFFEVNTGIYYKIVALYFTAEVYLAKVIMVQNTQSYTSEIEKLMRTNK